MQGKGRAAAQAQDVQAATQGLLRLGQSFECWLALAQALTLTLTLALAMTLTKAQARAVPVSARGRKEQRPELCVGGCLWLEVV